MEQIKQGVPEGYHTITPAIIVGNAAKAIEFYQRAFGAKEISRMPSPDGKIMHAELKFGDSIVFLSDEFPDMGARSPESLGGTSSSLHMHVQDVDAVFAQAVKAGATVVMPVADMFWGDRYGNVKDPFGHTWGIATRKETLTPTQVQQRAAQFFASAAKGKV